MKIAVIGAGVVGITTAYELAEQGHQVSVFEKRSAAAEEMSFANAGLASVGYAIPWTQPGRIQQALKMWGQRNTPLRLTRPRFRDLRWLWHARKANPPEVFRQNQTRLLKLATFSDLRMKRLTDTLRLEPEHAQGLMVLLRGERDAQAFSNSLTVLRDAGFEFQTLSADQARTIEPALRAETNLHQAIYFENDEIGNCRQFTLLLKQEAEALGVSFHFNTTVQPLSRATPSTLTTHRGSEKFDAIVVCAGLGSESLTRALGIKLAQATIHGYTLSAPVRELLDAPKSAVVDERYKVSISRLGQRIRLSGGSELGATTAHLPSSLQTLYKVLDDWFPGAARTQDNVQVWKSAYPVIADGMPLVGVSPVPGIWLNTGHAHLGWTLACGCAKLLADQISGQATAIDLQGLGSDRRALS